MTPKTARPVATGVPAPSQHAPRRPPLPRPALPVGGAVQSEARRRPFDRLIAGGPDEALSALLSVLPRSLSGRLAGTFTAELFASNEHIVDHVRSLEERAEREAEARLRPQAPHRAPG